VTYTHDTFIIVGDGGTILQSDPLIGPATPSRFENLKLDGGFFNFTVRGDTGQVNRIDASSDLSSWLPLGRVTNASGCVIFRDTNAATQQRQFYRAVNVAP